MPDNLNQLAPLSIQKIYTLLESITIPEGLYDPKYEYASLDKTKLSFENTKQFLVAIENILTSSSAILAVLLDVETTKALFKLEENAALNTLIVQLRQQQAPLTLDLLCKQLAEFIDLCRLLHFISMKPESRWSAPQYWMLLWDNQTTLEKFSGLIRLKFKLFQSNLLDFLKTTQEQSDLLEKMLLTLITDYLPQLAVAKYPTGISLSKYDTTAEQIKEKIVETEIPLLTATFKEYQQRILDVKVNEEEDDEDIYCDAEEDFFYDAEDNPDVNPKTLTSSSSDVIADNENNHKQHVLARFWSWIKNTLKKIINTEKGNSEATTFHSTKHEESHAEPSANSLPSTSHRYCQRTSNRTNVNDLPSTAWKDKNFQTKLSSNRHALFTQKVSLQSKPCVPGKHFIRIMRFM